MKTVAVLFVLVALASAQFGQNNRKFANPAPKVARVQPSPQRTSPQLVVPIVRQSQDAGIDGTYHYSFEAGNGIVVDQKGYLKNAGIKDQEAQVVEGSYSYPGPDGRPLTIKYYADETGFHAEGDHLPVPVKA